LGAIGILERIIILRMIRVISYTDAFFKAKEIREEIDSCIEYENGYVFCSDKGKDQAGGYYSPIVILKDDGKAVDMSQFVVNGTGKELKSFSL